MAMPNGNDRAEREGRRVMPLLASNSPPSFGHLARRPHHAKGDDPHAPMACRSRRAANTSSSSVANVSGPGTRGSSKLSAGPAKTAKPSTDLGGRLVARGCRVRRLRGAGDFRALRRSGA
jgi:hypothetical protein